MNFEEVVGNFEVIKKITELIKNDKVGHAYVFTGPDGIGKTTIAMDFAAILLCNENTKAKSCKKCRPCELFLNSSNPDFSIIKVDSGSIGVDEIRKLQTDIIIAPMYSPKKVYLIENAEKMTVQAQNCLLKTLEEPPSHTVIILTTSNYDSLLETVRSRLSRYTLKKSPYSEVYSFLEKNFGKSENIKFIASYADGVIGNALKLVESKEFENIRENSIKLVFDLLKSDLSDVFSIFNFFESNKLNVDYIFSVMILLYRDMLVIKKSQDESMLINSDKRDIILYKLDEISSTKITRNIEIIEATRHNLKQNANFQLAIETMLMRLREGPESD